MEERIVHDDNVFRLSSGADPNTLVGSASKGDTYRVTSFGLNLDAPVSRQRLVISLSANDSRYERFHRLDFTGHDLRAAWLWRMGDSATGQLGYSESATLASFASIFGTAPDHLRARQAFFNGAFLVTPRWRIQAEATAFEQRNSDPALRVNDVNIVDGGLTLSYVTPAGSSLGLSARSESGAFPTPQPVGSMLVDNAYRQERVGLVAEWPATAASRLSGRIERVSRRYDQLPQRDFDGTTARIQYDWQPTAKLKLVSTVQRDVSPFEYIRSSFVMVTGLTLRPTYSVTSKLDIAGALDFVTRDYLGDPSPVLGVAAARSERVRSAGVLLSYRPLRTVTLQASILHETRSANIAFGDYVANVVWLSARLAF